LRNKLEETLALDYAGPVEVIVASDGSTDETEAIAQSLSDRGVRLVCNAERLGKEAAQAAAIPQSQGEILVFTDVGAELEKEALCNIARPFSDPTVACVSSEDWVESEEGEKGYVQIEMALRRMETAAATLVGLSGSFFAARRSLCSPWPAELASDFRCALEAVRRGQRAVAEPTARARFGSTAKTSSEWTRRVRTVRRGLAVLSAYRDLLHPRYGRAAFCLWGHKLARFTSPIALLVLLGASAAAAGESSIAAALLVAQGFAYGLGLTALLAKPVARRKWPRFAGFFLLVNASVVVAWLYHLSGQRAVTWQPTRR
jgi:cellulose synthase/poly-beta-1,6-N-acetylglucosamine synthase-like glycosyltransferase